MIYLIFKSINLDTRIGVSNLKDKIKKSTLTKFGNNIKDLIDDMSSNYSIIVDKVNLRENYVRQFLGIYCQGQTQL